MTESNTARIASNSCEATARPAADARRGDRLGLTHGQRVLAAATAAAILVSGANALVQMARVLAQCWLIPAQLGDKLPDGRAALPPPPPPTARQDHTKGRRSGTNG